MRNKKRTGSSQTIHFAEVGKYLAVFLLLVYVALLLIYSSGSTKSFEDVANQVEDGIEKEHLVKQNAQAVKRYYRVNSADYEGVLLYTSKDSISPEEILLVKVKTDRQVQSLQDAVWQRVESRKNSFENIAPDQVAVLEKAQILVRGRFVFLIVSQNAQEYSSLFTNSL